MTGDPVSVVNGFRHGGISDPLFPQMPYGNPTPPPNSLTGNYVYQATNASPWPDPWNSPHLHPRRSRDPLAACCMVASPLLPGPRAGGVSCCGPDVAALGSDPFLLCVYLWARFRIWDQWGDFPPLPLWEDFPLLGGECWPGWVTAGAVGVAPF